jgi:hypothetical protein
MTHSDFDNIKWNGKRYDYRMDETLHSLQVQHINGELDIYAPIEAYYEQFDKEGNPVPGTRVRKDLPSIAQQWKASYQRRYKDG